MNSYLLAFGQFHIFILLLYEVEHIIILLGFKKVDLTNIFFVVYLFIISQSHFLLSQPLYVYSNGVLLYNKANVYHQVSAYLINLCV